MSKIKDTGYYLGLILLLVSGLSAQSFLWKYTWPTNQHGDWVYKIITGGDGNIYIAGMTDWDDFFGDIAVVSLTPSGAERWKYRRYSFHSLNDYASSVAYANNRIYGCGMDGIDNTSDKFGAVFCLNASNGSVIWFDSIGTLAFNDICADNAGCYVVRFYSGHPENGIWGLNSSGQVQWQHSYDLSSVVLGSDGKIYAAGGSGVISFTNTGSINWTYNWTSQYPKITYGSDGNIYVAGQYTLLSLDNNGGLRWQTGTSIQTPKQVSYSSGRVYVAGLDPSSNGVVNCYSSSNGAQLWSYSGEAGKSGVIGLPNNRCAAAGWSGTSPTNQKFYFAVFDATGGIVYSYTDTDTTRTFGIGGLCYVESQNVVAAAARAPWLGAYGFNPGTGIEESSSAGPDVKRIGPTLYTASGLRSIPDLEVFGIDGRVIERRNNLGPGVYFLRDRDRFQKIVVVR